MGYAPGRGIWQMPSKRIEMAAILVFALGCGHESAATQQVRTAASIDLDCDESVIELDETKPMETRATGCGRSLSYMYKCTATAGGQSCRWTPVRDESNKLD